MHQDEFILSRNPESPRQSVRIDKVKYQIVRAAILANLFVRGALTFQQLGRLVNEQLQDSFDGSVPWHYATVKMDLEARGEIRLIPNSKPPRIEMARTQKLLF